MVLAPYLLQYADQKKATLDCISQLVATAAFTVEEGVMSTGEVTILFGPSVGTGACTY
jgi:hypothetical protein